MRAYLCCLAVLGLTVNLGCTKRVKSTADTTPATPKQVDLLAGKSLAVICTDDTLLLTRYKVETLHGTPLPSACCAQGVLPEAESHRCELDWPSSDVPSCNLWLELRDRLLRAYGVTDSSALPPSLPQTARSNVETLKRWHAASHACGD